MRKGVYDLVDADQAPETRTPETGCRYRTHNNSVSRTTDSQHCLGTAADVACPRGFTPKHLAEQAELIPVFRDAGIGIYPEDRFVHVDVRGTKVRWGYLGGKYVDYEVAVSACDTR
jgi:uncharacterized protein YcbK (DUF882 family)